MSEQNSLSTIVIMADFAGPYAWIRHPGQQFHQSNKHIGDVVLGFSEEYGVSKKLEEGFADWEIDFDRNSEKDSFEWKEWNADGIALAKKLKDEVGDRYLVEYHIPVEDPGYSPKTAIIKI